MDPASEDGNYALVWIGGSPLDLEHLAAISQQMSNVSATVIPKSSPLASDSAAMALIRLSQIVAAPSASEGFGLLVAESCASEVPVAVADTPASRWLARPETGFCRGNLVRGVIPLQP